MYWWYKKELVGVGWMLVAAFLASLVLASGKLTRTDIPVFQIVFMRYLSGFVILFAMITLNKRLSFRETLTTSCLFLHMARAVSGIGGITCLLFAAMNIPLADVTAISLTQNMFIVLFAVLLLGETVSPIRWVAIACCALGAFLIVHGQQKYTSSIFFINLSVGMALLGACLVAAEMIFIKLLASQESPLTMLFYINGLGIVIFAFPGVASWQSVTVIEQIGLMLLGPIAIAAQHCTVQAYRCAEASLVAPVNYCGIVFAGGIGFLIFGEIPEPVAVIGSLMITIGGVVLAKTIRSSQTTADSVVSLQKS
ncbi:DMT family transporter [Spartinivicinus ruber]|uniref:DMT family transporter n=1 Tax=Spartinivicinus ruber TaxID=2683272 RepID=UPI0013D8C3B7|nr:DMT family transporter [Spartinivicinus ruber]